MSEQFGPEYVRAIAPYQAGKPIAEVAREFGLDEANIVKLASNENPFGMPESSRAAMAAAAADLGRYPDANGFELKAALAKRYDVPADWITLGNGSNDILEIAAHAFVQKARRSSIRSTRSPCMRWRRRASVRAPSWCRPWTTVTTSTRWRPPSMPTRAWCSSPTRTTRPAPSSRPRRSKPSCKRCRRNVIVVLDEAYNEYLAPEHQFESSAWVRNYPNLIVSRTFSKAYGLAGLRVGFAIAQPAVTDLMNRIRQPFNVNSLAQAAAVAALNDKAFLDQGARNNAAGYRADDRSLRRTGPRVRAVVRQLRAGAGRRRRRRRRARQPGAAQAGRDRAPGRQLRPAAVAAHLDRPAAGKRGLHRRR